MYYWWKLLCNIQVRINELWISGLLLLMRYIDVAYINHSCQLISHRVIPRRSDRAETLLSPWKFRKFCYFSHLFMPFTKRTNIRNFFFLYFGFEITSAAKCLNYVTTGDRLSYTRVVKRSWHRPSDSLNFCDTFRENEISPVNCSWRFCGILSRKNPRQHEFGRVLRSTADRFGRTSTTSRPKTGAVSLQLRFTVSRCGPENGDFRFARP